MGKCRTCVRNIVAWLIGLDTKRSFTASQNKFQEWQDMTTEDLESSEKREANIQKKIRKAELEPFYRDPHLIEIDKGPRNYAWYHINLRFALLAIGSMAIIGYIAATVFSSLELFHGSTNTLSVVSLTDYLGVSTYALGIPSSALLIYGAWKRNRTFIDLWHPFTFFAVAYSVIQLCLDLEMYEEHTWKVGMHSMATIFLLLSTMAINLYNERKWTLHYASIILKERIAAKEEIEERDEKMEDIRTMEKLKKLVSIFTSVCSLTFLWHNFYNTHGILNI